MTDTAGTQSGAFSLDDIRQLLSDGIRDLRSGTSSPANINALSNATGKILSSVKLEMEYYRLIGKTPKIGMIDKALPPPEEVP